MQAKASGITLDNLPGWPRIENISGNLHLHGNRMEFDAAKADTLGTQLSKVELAITDMAAPEVVLHRPAPGRRRYPAIFESCGKVWGNDYGALRTM